MAKESRIALKAYFNTGDRPTEQQFANLIDSVINITDDITFPTLTPTEISPPPLSGFAFEVATDCAAATSFYVPVSESTNINEPTNGRAGQIYTWMFEQTGDGNAELAFPRGFRLQDFGMVTGTANISILQCIYSATLGFVEVNAKQLS